MWNEKRNDVIAGLEPGDARPAFHHDARGFVAENRREIPGLLSFVDVQVGVAQTGGLHLHQHFAGARPFELDVFDDKRLIRTMHDGGADVQRHEEFLV
jgi:hypothetical protein